MPTHLHLPDIDRLATRRAAVADSVQYRHLGECDLCVRRLIDEVLRLAAVEEDGQPGARALELVGSN